MTHPQLKRKTFARYRFGPTNRLEECPTGPVFSSPIGAFDLSQIGILHAGVDTVRALYSGRLNEMMLDQIESAGFDSVIEVAGLKVMIGPGGQSGYRYRLQNNEAGLILFVLSRYTKPASIGAHLKIEAGPAFLLSRAVDETQHSLDCLASAILNEGWAPSGCAVHVCADVQGWGFPDDFLERLATRSRQQISHKGIAKIEMVGGLVAQVYGSNETLTFGQPGGIQFTCYRKDIANERQGKTDFSSKVWERAHDDNGVVLFDPDAPVRRLEFRYHQTVIRQIAYDVNSELLRYETVARRLNDLWQYGLSIFRLDQSRKYIDPFWQLLYEDVEICVNPRRELVKRVYKGPGTSEYRNLCLCIGNALSIYARESLSPTQAIDRLRRAGLWRKYAHYARQHGNDPQADVTKGLLRRRLAGKAS